MNIGIDIDGVLADFTEPFMDRMVQVTGKDLFPKRPFDVPTWDWPQVYGYTNDEVKQTFASIRKDPSFWRSLKAYPDAQVLLNAVGEWVFRGHSVYFITNRAGIKVKDQTEQWLTAHLFNEIVPTVLICVEKGTAAKALDLDAYIDDRFENIEDVKRIYPKTAAILRDQPWNRESRMQGVSRVNDLRGFVWIVNAMGGDRDA